MNRIRNPHQPDPANELFCLACGKAIEQAELGPCPVKEANHDPDSN